MRVTALFSLLICVQVILAKRFTIDKCCRLTEQLDYEMKMCVPIREEESRNKTIESITENILRFNFIPHDDQQEYEIDVSYHTLTDIELEVTYTIAIETEPEYIGREFESPVDSLFTNDLRGCYDFSENQNRSPVYLFSASLKALHKCCAEGERLNEDGSHCEPVPGKVRVEPGKRRMEIIDAKTSDNRIWIPELFSERTIKVAYSFMNRVYQWEVIARDGANLSWNIVPPKYFKNFLSVISITKNNSSGPAKNFLTDIYCFDEVAKGPLAPRALLAAIYDIRKCCGKGYQFDHLISSCIPRPDLPQQDEIGIDSVNRQQNPHDAFWLPKALRNQSLLVLYQNLEVLEGGKRIIYDDELWKYENSDENLPGILYNVTLVSSKTLRYITSYFCFEYIDDFKTVLFVRNIHLNDAVTKCCYPNEILSDNGFCVKHEGPTWTPGSSVAREYFDPHTTTNKFFKIPVKEHCRKFSGHSTNTTIAIKYLKGRTRDEYRWKRVLYCNDLQMINGTVQEVVGSCVDTPTGDAYEIIRPLGVVSTILLAAAAMASVVQKQTRQSAHGRAFACHALCLSFANALQIIWFFRTVGRNEASCIVYSYSIYFFLTASNFWLTSITVNMARGFRQPLGAMAATKRKIGNKSIWKQFALMSLFAWGGAVILTALAVTMDLYKERIREIGLIPPSFFETRTCQFESNLHDKIKLLKFSGRLGALLFYYVPMVILIVTNAVCVFLTAYTVSSLQRDKAFLQRDVKPSLGFIPQQTLRNALLYSKLLLTAGIAELLLEAVIWAVEGPIETVNVNLSLYESVEKSYIFSIATTFLNFIRAVTVLWLCSGKLCSVIGTALSNFRKRLFSAVNNQKATHQPEHPMSDLTLEIENTRL